MENNKGDNKMSDNRMYLRCKICGETILLGKCNCGEYTVFGSCIHNDLNHFFTEHAYCDKEPNKNDISKTEKAFTPMNDIPYDNQFEIAYEFGE